MNEHALDAMIYAWMVMKEKEESSMEGIFMGQITGSCSRISEEDGKRCAQVCFHDTESNACSKLSHYNKTYSLVLSDDVIKTNDELLTLREKVAELEEELMEIKTTRNLREAYITGVEKGCESLREDRDTWKRRWNSVVTDIGKSLEANGIKFTLKEVHGNGNWDVVIDIPELNEAKKKVEDLEKKLADSKSNETFWRGRKEEEEDYHHYWLHTFDRAVKQAAEKGIHIGVCGNDEDCNAGIVTLDNMKAEDLEKQVVQMEDANQKLRQRISSADEEVDKVDKYWQRRYDDLAECWTNTHKDIVAVGKKVGVKIDIQGKKSDSNTCPVYITNEKALELMVNVSNTKHEYNKKWQAMLNALKDKGVEVIYMGEQDGKPCVDVKIPGWDSDKEWVTTFSKRVAELLADKFGLESERDELKEQCDILRKDGALKRQQCLKLTEDLNALKKECGRLISELAELKSKTVAEVRYEFRPNCLTIIYAMCDGSKQTISMDSSEAIDANSISCGTVPKCESCKNHRYFTNGGHYCYLPDSEYKISGMFRCHSLTEEEAEGPACVDFKARKE